MTVSAGLVTAGFALAAVGSGPGQLQLSPATGPLATQATWSTTTACPAGFQGSAQVIEYTASGTFVSGISLVVSPASAVVSGATFQSTVGELLATSGSGLSAAHPGTDEWVVGCYTGAGTTGNVCNDQSLFVTANADGTYTTSATFPGSSTPSPCSNPSASASPSTPASPATPAWPSAPARPSTSDGPSTSAKPSSTPTSSPTPSPTRTRPSDAPAAGAAGPSRPAGPDDLLIALGAAAAVVGSAASIGLFLRRRRRMRREARHGDPEPEAT